MPLQTENAGSINWTDLTAAGQSKPVTIGRAKPIRSLYVICDFSGVGQTAPTELAGPGEVLDVINISYDTKHIEIRGRELINTQLGFYKTQGSYPMQVPSATASNMPYSLTSGNTEAFVLRGVYRVPVGAPASSGQNLGVTVSLSGYATWATTVADIASATGTLYFFVDQTAAIDMSYATWHDRVINQTATLKEFIPAQQGESLVGISLLVSNDVDDWITGAQLSDVRHNNYLDALSVVEVKNAEQIYRYDTPLAFAVHSSRFMSSPMPQSTPGATNLASNKNYPSGCYWLEMDNQAVTTNFRVKIATSATVDVDILVWFGDKVGTVPGGEVKVGGPTPGGTANSVPVNPSPGAASVSGGTAQRVTRR